MSKRAEGSRGDGPLLTFSRKLGDAIGGLPEDFERRMTVSKGEPGILGKIEGGLEAFGLRSDGVREIVAVIRRSYAEQLIKDLVRKDLMGGRDHIRSSERSFEKSGTVRALEFASGTGKRPLGYHGEVWSPATSRILGAQILHRFSVNSQPSGESVFRWAVVEMPETRCEFRDAVLMGMGDTIDVTFVSGRGDRVGIHDSALLGIAKGAGQVKWVQRLTISEFTDKLAGAVS